MRAGFEKPKGPSSTVAPQTSGRMVPQDGGAMHLLKGESAGLKTKREVVELGLRTLLKLTQQAKIRHFRGKLAWEGDLDAMRTDL